MKRCRSAFRIPASVAVLWDHDQCPSLNDDTVDDSINDDLTNPGTKHQAMLRLRLVGLGRCCRVGGFGVGVDCSIEGFIEFLVGLELGRIRRSAAGEYSDCEECCPNPAKRAGPASIMSRVPLPPQD